MALGRTELQRAAKFAIALFDCSIGLNRAKFAASSLPGSAEWLSGEINFLSKKGIFWRVGGKLPVASLFGEIPGRSHRRAFGQSCGFSFWCFLRVTYLIDGFNVYHSLVAALNQPNVSALKWLDYWQLCDSFRQSVTQTSKNSVLTSVHYFSAIAFHSTDKQVPVRHNTYMDALRATGVSIKLGNFKNKTRRCRQCGQTSRGHEEKETDVNIAIELFKCFHSNTCDAAVILSGDTDLVTAVREVKLLFPNKYVGVGFPYNRSNAAFNSVADFTFNIKIAQYQRHQLPNPVVTPNGSIYKPSTW